MRDHLELSNDYGLISPHVAAALLGKKDQDIRYMIRNNKLKAYKAKSQYLIPLVEVEALRDGIQMDRWVV